MRPVPPFFSIRYLQWKGVFVVSDLAFEFFKLTVLSLLQVLELAFLARSVLSLFDPMREWRLSGFLFVITEPIILPVRALLSKVTGGAQGPIDIAYMITFLCVMILETILSML